MNTLIRLNTTTANSSQRENRCGWTLLSSSASPFAEIVDHGDGDRGPGGYVCFACGRSTESGEPFVCVSRLQQVLQETNTQPRVLDAVASLQVCIPCTLMASNRELDWKHKPKLLHSEIHGFYLYARSLARGMAQMRSDTLAPAEALRQDLLTDIPYFRSLADTIDTAGRQHKGDAIYIISCDQCHSCCQTIGLNMPHMLIEIAVNIPTPQYMDLRNTFLAAKYCDTCSKELFSLKW